MAVVPGPSRSAALEGAARTQALLLANEVARYRRGAAALGQCRPGFCMADAWHVSHAPLDGSFDVDPAVLEALLRAAGPAPAAPAQPGAGSALRDYLYPPDPDAPPLSAARLDYEVRGAVYGAGNILANTTASLAGALQAVGERSSARALADGIRDILAGRVRSVPLAPGMELYNAAQGPQWPRVRLRVRGAQLQVVRQASSALGLAASQWRVNGPASAASTRVRGMTAQQMRNIALGAGEARVPGALRWATGLKGGGVLTFAPALLLDSYAAIETDLQTGTRHFNGRKFLVSQARSQSGNAVGFVGGIVAVTLAGALMAGAPLVLVGLAGGIGCQILWNWFGAADATAEAAERVLR